MAGIDKTYTDSFEEYSALVEWARDREIVFNYGHKTQRISVLSYIWSYDKENFTVGSPIPVMNTPTWYDVYMRKYCPIQFVQDRLKEVYSENYLENLFGEKMPESFKKNRKIKIRKASGCKFPIHNKTYNKFLWWVSCSGDLWYNKDLEAWIITDLFPYHTNIMHVKTLKALVRRLRGMYLPPGLEFMISGRYVGEIYKLTTK